MSTHDVIVIGGGPAGLACATALATEGVRPLVLEREAVAGGVPRHCFHPGFGIRDLHRSLSGPGYAARNVSAALEAGVEIQTSAMVTSLSSDRSMWVTSPLGRLELSAEAVVLATGARERPRAARLIAGDRPRGVYTTGQLQNLVHLQGRSIGSRAIVVGAELVSWSAVMTLHHAGCSVERVLAQVPGVETYGMVRLGAPLAFRTHLSQARVVEIHGKGEVSSVTIEHLGGGHRERIDCDTVVFTGDWIPDHELARMASLSMDRRSLGPVVDPVGRTSGSGFFAAGNLVHPVDTADVAALGGRHIASAIAVHLAGAPRPDGVPIQVDGALKWISPGQVTGEAPSRGYYLGMVDRHIRSPVVRVSQGCEEISHIRLPWPAAPGRPFRIPKRVLSQVDASASEVALRVV